MQKLKKNALEEEGNMHKYPFLLRCAIFDKIDFTSLK